MDESIPNILADRYATKPIKAIWSARGRVILEREFWIAVMKAQHDLGLDIPLEAIESYEACKDTVDLDSIKKRESVLLHDIKARIEEFNALAGYEHIHKGLTSRDLTENVEQFQVIRSLIEIRFKAVASLATIVRRAVEFKDLVISARTHNAAAQPTTVGRRLAMYGEELRLALEVLDRLVKYYPVRGIKGPVGTQVDQLTLFNGKAGKAASLEDRILEHLGFRNSLKVVGQVYPRSLDLETVSVLCQLASAPANFAKTMRIMAGQELASEGFAKGQVGSSSMPHKMNSRSCERINGFDTILKGYLAMAGGLSGDQWNEGDVSCSVVRRVFLPDSFFAIDGLLETFITVLDQAQFFPSMIKLENRRYFPFLATTTFLMEAIKTGSGREAAHEAIKEHAVAVALDMRNGKIQENDLIERLANDDRFGVSLEKMHSIMVDGRRMIGRAALQVDFFAQSILPWKDRFPDALSYKPGKIL